MSELFLAADLNRSWRSASGAVLRRAAAGLSAAMLLSTGFPPVAWADGHQNTICIGYYGLCAASTCADAHKKIRVNVTGGTTAWFEQADCLCPIFYGKAAADLTGGNMQGSCDAPASGVWSLFSPEEFIPQRFDGWSQRPLVQSSYAPNMICPASLGLGAQSVNCYSFACDHQTYINGVPVATCHCAMGESFDGKPVSPNTAFWTKAGQGDPSYCSKYPAAVPFVQQ